GRAAAQAPIYIDEGPDWTPATRADFYGRDQGSRMISLPWLQALKQPNGQPFLADSLARYGYLPNPANTNGLPVGFTASGPTGSQIAGMTCAACHTRQITVSGQAYRIDGGPAIVDFQSFLADLDTAVGQVLASDAAFNAFAAAVLGSPNPNANDVATLRQNVNAWYLRYHTLITWALPTSPWGTARLDAVGMIFDRLTGLDLGKPPSYLIPDNIKRADAPVRYPFLWNAPKQDLTQWPAFAGNGTDLLGLARNLGEVYGVFAVFQPTDEIWYTDFLNNNSANFDGLAKLEDLIKEIKPPKWPKEWPVDANLAARGEVIYNTPEPAGGGCKGCHGITSGIVRFPGVQTWATPVKNVQTDTREYDILNWTSQTGVLEGTFIPFVTYPLQAVDTAFNVLGTSVIGTIAEQALWGNGGLPASALKAATPNASIIQAVPGAGASIQAVPGSSQLKYTQLPPSLRDLQSAFPLQQAAPPPGASFQGIPVPAPTGITALAPVGSYESRVMEGIWAAAPYLHNGSVPTLAELLKPAAQRVKQFKIGNAYDINNVGLAVDQPNSTFTLVTTGCDNLNSGNSNCGHEYGTNLSDADKKALLEYLKTL
ncbi:MAG TPA: di-heme-cytochrome C peroxidase, partial [Xanthobacteraceae bacterium]|nr:di-heme-cytochrome C peroxidase [Xanthobacteraceae bacterium]